MTRIKNIFSIKDLENLSGIKAHTIRIWEKRYNVLEPRRSQTNIRYYDQSSLQKLLNITLLHDHGYKISKISKFPPEKIPLLVKEIISGKSAKSHAINAFKMAMMKFDQSIFFSTYQTLLSEKTFTEIFREVFLPLMNEIGLLWQTTTITPAHEHFISNLIKQKILLNTEKLHQQQPSGKSPVFVLFLPMDEIHELGLLYLNYEILLNGYRTVYLGENLPIENLAEIKHHFEQVIFVSYMTIRPEKSGLDAYLARLHNEVLTDDSQMWLFGKMTGHADSALLSGKIKLFQSLDIHAHLP